MGIHEQIGVRPFINAGGWMYTRYGGSIMPEPVLSAMVEASKNFVNLFQLQDRVGEAIAAMTQNESAFVSCGAASGILLAVAACIAGTDPQLANRLPDAQGMRNRVIMRRADCGTEADPAIRAAGGNIIQVDTTGGGADAEQMLHAINGQTGAILLVAFEGAGELDVLRLVQGARERNVPVLVDGAYALPPKQNLWRYTRELGVDAFVTSGGKAIRGPQSTGLVLGKRAIIEGCKFHASPNLRIGRGMKVGKEEFAGIYTALKLYLALDTQAQEAREKQQIASIAQALENIPRIKLMVNHRHELFIDLDPAEHKLTAEDAAKTLLNSDPSILLGGRNGRMTVRATQLQAGEELVVAARLRQFFIEGLAGE